MNERCVFQFSRQRASTLRREHFRPASLLLMHFIAASNGFASRYISSMHEYQRTAEKRERERNRKKENTRELVLSISYRFPILSNSSFFHLAICGVRWFKSTIKSWTITFTDTGFIIRRRKLSNCYFVRMCDDSADARV